MNPFAMRKENQAFVGLALTFDRFMDALENNTLKNQLKDAVTLLPEEIEKSKTALAYIEQSANLRKEIDALTKEAQEKYDAANALIAEAQKKTEEVAKYAVCEDARLDVLRKSADDRENTLNARHIKHEARDTQQTNRENALNARERTLETTHAQKNGNLTIREEKLAKERADHEEYQKNFRERAAAAQAALRG